MRKISYFIFIIFIGLAACKDKDIELFEKTADERVAEAIASLKADLVAPANGWKIKYKPESASGSYYVLMKFEEDNTVNIKTDLPANDGEYFDKTVTYRIDNSMGLELVLENYSFFSYLFEQNDATFLAEYEFNYVNKTPANELVFSSKTDIGAPTVILFQQAGANEESLLARELAQKLAKTDTILNPLYKSVFGNTSAKIVYIDKDLNIYMTFNSLIRTANFNYVSTNNDLQNGQSLNFSTGFILKGDSIVFDTPLNVNFNGNQISIKSLVLNQTDETNINLCATSITTPIYSGVTSSNDKITFEVTLVNNEGASFKDHDFYVTEIFRIYDENGNSVGDRISQDIKGALYLLIYNNRITATDTVNGVGFYIDNPSTNDTYAIKKSSPVFSGNTIEFNFEPEITILRGDPNPPANLNNIHTYLNKMTEGGKTYVYKINENFYELYNPCTKWSFVVQVF